MRIIPFKPGVQLYLVVDPPRDMSDDMTPDEMASVLTFARGRLVEPHEATGFSFVDGSGAA